MQKLYIQAPNTLPTILAHAAAAAAALNKQNQTLNFAMYNAKRVRAALRPPLAAAQARAARAALGAQVIAVQTAQVEAAAATAAVNSVLRALCRLLPVV